MSDDIAPRCIAIIIMVFAAALFAAAETAYSYCNRVRIRSLAENGDRRAKRVCGILDDFDGALVTLLIGINVLSVLISSLSTVLAVLLLRDVKHLSGYASLISTIFVTVVVFLFDETIPKNIAHENADSLALFFSLPLHSLMIVLHPAVLFFRSVSDMISRLFRNDQQQPSITSDELFRAIDSAESTGGITASVAGMLRNASGFREEKAEDIMKPISKVDCFDLSDIGDDKDNIKNLVLKGKYSRYPLISGNTDNVIGIVTEHDILDAFLGNEHINLEDISYKPLFVSPGSDLGKVYDDMIKSRCHMAVVKNNGKTLGIITLNDILSVLFGQAGNL